MASYATPARAEAGGCGGRAEAIVQQAYAKAQKSADGKQFVLDGHVTIDLPAPQQDSPFRVICKAWPAQDDLLLVAIPLMDRSQSSDGQHVGDLELLALDGKTLQVRQRLLHHGLLRGDAVAIRGLDFDTGPYRLAAGVLAFGLSIDYGTNSVATPFGQTDLRLYTVAHGGLRPVVDGIAITHELGEWDGNCAGESHAIKRVLSMNRTIRNGYHGISVAEQEEADKPSLDKRGECQPHPGKKVRRSYRLTYDGTRYRVPASFKPMPD
jgi:hypothetical protein